MLYPPDCVGESIKGGAACYVLGTEKCSRNPQAMVGSSYTAEGITHRYLGLGASHVALVVKNPCANIGNVRDVGSIFPREDLLEEGMATLSSILAWKIPRTEESGRLQPIGSKRVFSHEATWHTCTHLGLVTNKSLTLILSEPRLPHL